MRNFLVIVLVAIIGVMGSGCEPVTPSKPDNFSEYVEWVEVNGIVPVAVDINNDRRRITIDFQPGTDLSAVEVELILADGVTMVSPESSVNTFDLTNVVSFKVAYKEKQISYTILANSEEEEPGVSMKGKAWDISLLYYGGTHRWIEWNNEELFSNVVYVDQENQKHWLFDTFLFLEVHDGQGRYFESGFNGDGARRQEWETLLSRYFDGDCPVRRLNSVVSQAASELGLPKYKRQVIITMPAPFLDQKDWGSVDGNALDFSLTPDRVKACKWYVDNVIAKFEAGNYKHLALDGIYFVAEQLTNNRDFLPLIAEYIQSKGLKFYWIPYWGAEGMGEWKNMKFDYAYLQPNYAFPATKPNYSHLTDVINYAKSKNMMLEMEFDERALIKSSDYRADRLRDYIKAFKEAGVLYSQSLAYYQSDCMVHALRTSTAKEDNALYHDLCSEIMSRQHGRGEK